MLGQGYNKKCYPRLCAYEVEVSCRPSAWGHPSFRRADCGVLPQDISSKQTNPIRLAVDENEDRVGSPILYADRFRRATLHASGGHFWGSDLSSVVKLSIMRHRGVHRHCDYCSALNGGSWCGFLPQGNLYAFVPRSYPSPHTRPSCTGLRSTSSGINGHTSTSSMRNEL